MNSEETEKFVGETQNLPISSPISNQEHKTPKYGIKGGAFAIFLEPFQWLQMLSDQLNPTFILGIILVYGLSQGFAGSIFKVVTDFYWKDVQKLQPSVVQLYIGFYYIPWIMKPIWGLFTDIVPINGYRKRPYFVIAGVVGCVSALMVALLGILPAAVALGCLIGVSVGMAVADVTIDACIAKNSIEIRALAPDMQCLCGFCSSAGALIGYSTSGFFVHHLGPQVSLILLAIPPAFIFFLGFVIYEKKATIPHPDQKQKPMESLGVAVKGMYQTIKFPSVWKPSLYMYLSLALSISTHEGQFYWYTDPKAGPAFSQEFVGLIYAIGALASMVGVLIYHKALKDYPFRTLLFFAQLLYGLSGMLDLLFILRWNLALGIPDSFFVISEECVSRIVSRIRWIPMIVLSTRLCPLGIEGTFFALLMCIDSFGSLTSKWGGGMVLHMFNVTRTDFTNLWQVILIRNCLRIVTLGLIFLVPNTDPQDALMHHSLVRKDSSLNTDDDDDDDEEIELVPQKEKNVV